MNNRTLQSTWSLFAALCAAMLISACGGSTGSSPSVEKSSIVIGKVVSGSTAKSVAAVVPLAASDPIEVYLQGEPDLRTTVGADGSFTLRGLPAGSFTLVFTHDGVTLGTLTFSEVAPNQQITINVQVVEAEIVLVDEDRRGIGHAGIELEGLVENVITLSLTADSRFVIAGRSVVARPLITAIREGNTRKTVNDVLLGKRVHVKGTTVPDSTDVLAFEIKLQGDTDGTGSGSGEKKMTICHIPPGNPSKAKTLTIGSSAWPAHQAHGDTEGECK